jgi:hypothetical protein
MIASEYGLLPEPKYNHVYALAHNRRELPLLPEKLNSIGDQNERQNTSNGQSEKLHAPISDVVSPIGVPDFLHHDMSPRTPTPPHMRKPHTALSSLRVQRRLILPSPPKCGGKWPDKCVENAHLAQAARMRRGRKRHVTTQDSWQMQVQAQVAAGPLPRSVVVRDATSGKLVRFQAVELSENIGSLRSRLAKTMQINERKIVLFLDRNNDEDSVRKSNRELQDHETVAQLAEGVRRIEKDPTMFLLLRLNPSADYVFLPEWTPESVYKISADGSLLQRTDESISLTCPVRVGPLIYPHSGSYAIEFVLEKCAHRMGFYVFGSCDLDDNLPADAPTTKELRRPLKMNPYRAEAVGARIFTGAIRVQGTTPGTVWHDISPSVPSTTTLRRGDTVRLEFDTNTNRLSAWFGGVNYIKQLPIFADEANSCMSARARLCFMVDLRGTDSVRVRPPWASPKLSEAGVRDVAAGRRGAARWLDCP